MAPWCPRIQSNSIEYITGAILSDAVAAFIARSVFKAEFCSSHERQSLH